MTLTPAADPLLLDTEDLRTLTSDATLRLGISIFREHRVTALDWEPGERIEAEVQDSPDLSWPVVIDIDEEGLFVDCGCIEDDVVCCAHGVAVLLAYAARQPVPEVVIQGAADEAIEERIKRGRTEVQVQHLAGDRWFGSWQARSLGPQAGGPYTVQIRSVAEPLNHCTCPDFAVNGLGTCKHIEAVLHRLKRRGPQKFERYARQGPPIPVVALDWTGAQAPSIRLTRPVGELPSELSDFLDRWFDGSGVFTGRLPDDWHRFARQAQAFEALLLSEDVGAFVRQQAEAAEHSARAARLSEQIRRSGGHLPGVRARLYPYQVEGVAFLAGSGRAVLADDMGLGKTLQAIAAATVLAEEAGVARVLVVCPASLKHQWKREISRFTDKDAVVIEGSPAARLALYRQQASFTLVNYELVLRDAAEIQQHLSPDLLILDEAQRIKNWRTRTAFAVKAIDTRYAFVLTGTPLENRLEDLYSVMQVVDDRVLGPLWRFMIDFHVTDGRGKVLGYRNLGELRRRLRPMMLRRDRRLVRDQLPDRIETQVDVELDPKQRTLHDEAMRKAASIAAIAERRPLTPFEENLFMAALQNARMACNAAGLVDKETEGSPKLDELARLLEDLCIDGGRKVVVFSQWERMTAMAEAVCDKLGLGAVRLHGSIPTHKRGAIIERFENDPTVQVFLSTDAGGVGLNLQAASALVNLDVPWNPAVLDQRIGRIHRLGQKESVQVVLVVARKAYEEDIIRLVGGKRDLFKNVVDEAATEDVVGLSKRSVELALSTLGGGPVEEPLPESVEPVEPVEPVEVEAPLEELLEEAELPIAARQAAEPESAVSLAPLLTALQEQLGARIERILATGGGLLVVVDAVDPELEQQVEALSGEVPVALIDVRTRAALARLGAASPAQGETLFERAAAMVPAVPPALALARRKLSAAEVLAERGLGEEAIASAVAAMLHAAAARAALPQPPPEPEQPLWLYGDLVPKGILGPEDAAALGRARALSSTPGLPAELVRQVVADAAGLVGRTAIA